MILIAKRTNTRSFAAAAFVAALLSSLCYLVLCTDTPTRPPNPPTLSHALASARAHTYAGGNHNRYIETRERGRASSPQGETLVYGPTTKGRPTVVSVGSLCWVSVRGGGDYLENGDAVDPCIEAVFYLSGTEGRVAWRGSHGGTAEPPGSVSWHYILLHCVDRCSYPSGAWPADVPLRVWLHLNRLLSLSFSLFYSLFSLSLSLLPLFSPLSFSSLCTPRPRRLYPSMKIHWRRASFLALVDHPRVLRLCPSSFCSAILFGRQVQ